MIKIYKYVKDQYTKNEKILMRKSKKYLSN